MVKDFTEMLEVVGLELSSETQPALRNFSAR